MKSYAVLGPLSEPYQKRWRHIALFEVKQMEKSPRQGKIGGTVIFNDPRLNPDLGPRLTYNHIQRQ
jgi:hypothetical protein